MEEETHLDRGRNVALVLGGPGSVDGNVRFGMAVVQQTLHPLLHKCFALLQGLVLIRLEDSADFACFFKPKIPIDDPIAAVAQSRPIQSRHLFSVCFRLPCPSSSRGHRSCCAHPLNLELSNPDRDVSYRRHKWSDKKIGRFFISQVSLHTHSLFYLQ